MPGSPTGKRTGQLGLLIPLIGLLRAPRKRQRGRLDSKESNLAVAGRSRQSFVDLGSRPAPEMYEYTAFGVTIAPMSHLLAAQRFETRQKWAAKTVAVDLLLLSNVQAAIS